MVTFLYKITRPTNKSQISEMSMQQPEYCQ